MKAKFLKIAGVKSEKDFYKKYPTEESFFRAHPEAQQMAQGGQPYPGAYPEYGMQGRGAGAQIPVETWFAYGGASNGPLGYFEDGGSPFNYGAFPAFAQKGNQVQGGDIDSTVSSRLNNFLVGINKNVDDNITKEALAQISQAYPMAQYGMQQSTYNPNLFGADMYQAAADKQTQGDFDAFGNAVSALSNSAIYKLEKQIGDKSIDYLKKNTKKKNQTPETPETPAYQPTTMRAGNNPFGPQITPFDQSFIDMNQNYYQRGGNLPKHQVAPGQTGTPANQPSNSDPLQQMLQSMLEMEKQRKTKNISDEEQRKIEAAKTKFNVITNYYNNNFSPYKYLNTAPGIDSPYPLPKDYNSNPVSNFYFENGVPVEMPKTPEEVLALAQNAYKEYQALTGAPDVTDVEPSVPGEPVVGELEKFKTTPSGDKKTTGTPGTGGGKKPELIIPTAGATAAEPKSTGQPAGAPAAKTTTSVVDQSEEERRKSAAYALAGLYGATPEQQEAYWQSIKNSMTGVKFGAPYEYVGAYGVPYKYKRRGYSPYPIATDTGYFPTGSDVQGWISQAVAAGANPEDIQVKYKNRPFGMGRKIVFKANFNPQTGKVETKPEVEATPSTPAPTWGVTQQTPSPMLTDLDRYNLDKEQAIREGIDYEKQKQIQEQAGIPLNEPVVAPEGWYKQGGLHRFLPKAQAGMMTPEGTFAFDNLDINIPIASQLGKAYQKTKGFVDSAKDFTRNLGPDFKATIKEQAGVNLSPYAGQGVMAAMRLAERVGTNITSPDYEKEAAIKRIAPFTSVGTNKGDYSPTGASTGMFRADQTNYAFNTGNMGNIPGRIMDRGGSVAYSDWSQTPVNGYYGVPQGEFSPYSQWSQSPVKMAMGGTPTEQYLTDEEIAEIIQMGGQVEYLD